MAKNTPILSAKVKIDGEKEYQEAINNISQANKDLRSEMQQLQSDFAGNAESMTGLGEIVESLAGKIGIDLPDAATDALNGMESFSSGTVAKMALVATAIVAVGAELKKLYDMTIEMASEVDNVITNSIITGIDTDLYQKLQYASELVDVSTDTITSSLVKLTNSMDSARNGSATLQEGFERLGVSVTDSDDQLRDAYDVFLECIDALGDMENKTEASALANDLFGRSYSELKPLIAAGSEALEEYGEQAEACGYVLDEYQIAKLGEVDDTYQELQNTITAFKKQLAADFAPAAKSAMETFQTAVETAGDMLEKSGLIENLATILSCLFDIIEDVVELVGSIPGLDSVLQGLKVTLGAISQFLSLIADVADVVTGVLTGDWNQVGTALGLNKNSGQASNWQTTYMQQSGTWDQYQSYYSSKNSTSEPDDVWYGEITRNIYDHNAGGTDNWRGGLTWTGENGPELALLPQGTQIMTAQESRNIGGDTFYITIDAASVKDFNDIVEMAQSARVRSRMR